MTSKERKLTHPNYLLTKYQSELYRQLSSYMKSNNKTQKEVAEKLKVSSSYVSQILNGNFNFTLKKLIELGLMIGKVPVIEFVDSSEYWDKQRDKNKIPTISINIKIDVQVLPVQTSSYRMLKGPKTYSIKAKESDKVNLSELEYSN